MSKTSTSDWKKASDLVGKFYNRGDSEPFREPVPWKEWGLTDYPTIVKEPMDLGTVRSNIADGNKYTTLYQVHDDVTKVWNNCMTYNAQDSDFYKLAAKLQKAWNNDWNKLLKQLGMGTGAETSTKLTSSDRKNFAKSLYGLEKEDLGKLLVEIENKSPAALTRNAEEDMVELNVDKIPDITLVELQKLVQKMEKKRKR